MLTFYSCLSINMLSLFMSKYKYVNSSFMSKYKYVNSLFMCQYQYVYS